MTTIEIEQLKNDLATKIGTLENKINNNEIDDDVSIELVKSFKEYEENGTTLEELKLLYGDVLLALGKDDIL